MAEFVDPLKDVGRVIVNWRGQEPEEGTYIGYREGNPQRCCVDIDGRHVWVYRKLLTVPA